MSLAAAPDDLGSHILDGPAEGVGPALAAAELLGETEVGQHDVTFSVQEDVLELYVPVDYAELVGRLETLVLVAVVNVITNGISTGCREYKELDES